MLTDMMAWLPWIFFVIALLIAAASFLKQSETSKRLSEAEEKRKELETALEKAQKQPVAIAAGAGAPSAVVPVSTVSLEKLADLEKELATTRAEADTLQRTVADAEKRLQQEKERGDAALAKAASADATLAQARSKAAEASHLAVAEAKRETESVRAALQSAEANLAAATSGEHTRRLRELETLTASLKNRLAEAEAAVKVAEETKVAAERARAEAVIQTENTLRESFSAEMQAAKATWARELEARLMTERERFETEQRRLSAELEVARLSVVPVAAEVVAPEPVLPVRPRPTPTKAAEIGADSEEKPLVLLADSDANAVKTITKHLEAGGYAVKTLSTLTLTVEAARASAPAAIALDGANLPDGDCWKALAAIKEDAELKEIPVIVFAPGKDKERALEMGAAGCFAKPIDKNVLVATIKAALVKRKQRARLAAVTGGTSGAPRRSSLLTKPTV